jgi:hypothetical protein
MAVAATAGAPSLRLAASVRDEVDEQNQASAKQEFPTASR